MRSRSLIVALALAVLGSPSVLTSQEPARGWLHVVWDGLPDADAPDGTRFYLVDDAGRSVLLRPPQTERAALIDLDRRRLEVRTSPFAFRALEAPPALSARAVTPAPFITLLCRFADDPSTPFNAATVERVIGPTYPGMAHYYGELSGDANVMTGNRSTQQWYNLPSPRSTYVFATSSDVGAIARDCAAAADADVDFSPFAGINIQLNGALNIRPTPPFDTLSFGGGWTLSLDGQTRQIGMTWLSRLHVANYVVVPHEMGHALGWPHSSGNYGQEYDSRWDLMSVGYLHFVQPFGWLSIHTIAPHKYARGWIPAAQVWEPALNVEESRVIDRSALPPVPGDALMAKINLGDGSWYAVEARRTAGYDTPLPGDAILIHRVSFGRAYVVDPDNNGNPNDAAAMWLPGETFSDPANGVLVRVDSANATGFGVSIIHGVAPVTIVSDTTRPTGRMGANYEDALVSSGGNGYYSWLIVGGSLPPGVTLSASGLIGGVPRMSGTFRFTVRVNSGGLSEQREFVVAIDRPLLQQPLVLDHLLGGALLTADEARFLDLAGNQNGVFDIGDVRAWLIANGGLPATVVKR